LKPIKRGFKIWDRADSENGYIDNFVVYMGKSDHPATNLGYKVVTELCKDILWEGRQVFFDNCFSSVHLAVDLLKHGTTCVATMQPDKVDFPRDVINKGAIAGQSRGFTTSTVLDNKVHFFV